MATQAPNSQAKLPLLYKSLTPLSSSQHGNLKLAENFGLDFIKGVHAVPVTVDEFVMVQRFFPIVFAPGDPGTPLALMGLTEGENLFLNKDGTWPDGVYVPAYIRRYPFMLARLAPDAKELSLCFDDQSGLFEEVKGKDKGNLVDGTEPTERVKAILKFCEQFEVAIQRTRAFMNELKESDLLEAGEATVQEGEAPKASFRGFMMVAEKKLHELRGDQHRKMVRSGSLGLIYAHLFSLSHMRDLYAMRREDKAAA